MTSLLGGWDARNVDARVKLEIKGVIMLLTGAAKLV